jgi:hypothetical protein
MTHRLQVNLKDSWFEKCVAVSWCLTSVGCQAAPAKINSRERSHANAPAELRIRQERRKIQDYYRFAPHPLGAIWSRRKDAVGGGHKGGKGRAA